MPPFVERSGQILPLSPLKLDFRIARPYKPLTDGDIGAIFGQDDEASRFLLLQPDSEEELIATTPDADQTDFGNTLELLGDEGESVTDEDPLTAEPESRSGERLTILQQIGRITLGLILTAGTIYIGVLVYLQGATALLTKFQSVGWFWQMLMFSAGFYLVSMPFGWGYIVLNLLGGYLYGFWIGQAVVMSTAFIGTLLGTLTLRYMGQEYVREKVEKSPKLRALSAVVNGKNAFYVIALTRLSPFPFGLQTALFSVSSVPMGMYMLATTVGLFPLQAINTWAGTSLHSIQDVIAGNKEMDGMTYAIFAVQIVVGVLVTAGVLYATKVQLHKTMNDRANMELTATL